MKIHTTTSLLIAAIIGLAMSACSESTPSAPKDTVKEIRELLELGPSKVAEALSVKPFVTLDSLKTESVPLGRGEFKINLEITWKTEEALYAVDEIAMAQVPPVPNSITLLKQVNKSGEKITIYGSIKAEQITKSHWKLDESSLKIEDNKQATTGQPIGAFSHNSYVTGTPEADKAIEAQKQLAVELQAKARREAEERRIREEKEAQERAKRAEQERLANAIRGTQEQRARIENEIQATKDNQERQVKALRARTEQNDQNSKEWLETQIQQVSVGLKAIKEEKMQFQGNTQIQSGLEAQEKEIQATIARMEKETQEKIEERKKSTQADIDLLEKQTQPKLEQLETQAQALKEREEKLRQEAEALRQNPS